MGAVMVSFVDFQRLAVECRQKARKAQDTQTKAIWQRMAKRWMVCADLAGSEDRAAAGNKDGHSSRQNNRFAVQNDNDANESSRTPVEDASRPLEARS